MILAVGFHRAVISTSRTTGESTFTLVYKVTILNYSKYDKDTIKLDHNKRMIKILPNKLRDHLLSTDKLLNLKVSMCIEDNIEPSGPLKKHSVFR